MSGKKKQAYRVFLYTSSCWTTNRTKFSRVLVISEISSYSLLSRRIQRDGFNVLYTYTYVRICGTENLQAATKRLAERRAAGVRKFPVTHMHSSSMYVCWCCTGFISLRLHYQRYLSLWCMSSCIRGSPPSIRLDEGWRRYCRGEIIYCLQNYNIYRMDNRGVYYAHQIAA